MPEAPRRHCVLVIGDAVAPTGFARVVREIFRPLAASWKIFQLGTNYFGDPHDWPWPIYPAALGRYATGTDRIAALVEKLKPALVFAINDPWVLAEYLEALSRFENLKTVVYCAFNTGPIDPEVLARLRLCDRFVVYTEFARRAVREGIERAEDPLDFPAVEVMPHGVDTDTFHPLEADRERARRRARETFFPNQRLLQEGFIVLNANRNQPRKRIDVTMVGFARFAAGRPPGVFLHLHMGSKDMGWDIRRLGRRLGIDDRLILTDLNPSVQSIDDEQLNILYNAADVGINTAASEGWGLVSMEQGAAGLAQIVPDHTGGRELWQGSAQLLKPTLSLIDPHTLAAEHLIDPAAVAESLADLHARPDLLRELEAAAYRNATRRRYRWNRIAADWERVFRELLSAPSGVPGIEQTSSSESSTVKHGKKPKASSGDEAAQP